MKKNIRAIAIHLPQFHPFEENDEWWGKGFTEWTNVTKAKPLYDAHYQPHLPADLGFYDLRLEEARLAQIALAKDYGIYGFCYYHYWFNGKRLMHEPLDRMLKNPKEDFPFMLCWANENWTRTWDGKENEVLIKQEYSKEDHINHAKTLIPFFKDNRYIKVDGKPVFIIYKTDDIPNLTQTIKIWRDICLEEKIQLYICKIERITSSHGSAALSGFDAAVDFQPLSPNFKSYINQFKKQNNLQRLRNKFLGISRRLKLIPKKPLGYDYEDYINFDLSQEKKDYKIFPCVSPMWDNTARKGKNSFLFHNASPRLYQRWLNEKLKRFIPFSKEENFLFINAWNEWAEGNHLEPCQKWGLTYLEATKEALEDFQ